jgi:hypothetical protein
LQSCNHLQVQPFACILLQEAGHPSPEQQMLPLLQERQSVASGLTSLQALGSLDADCTEDQSSVLQATASCHQELVGSQAEDYFHVPLVALDLAPAVVAQCSKVEQVVGSVHRSWDC